MVCAMSATLPSASTGLWAEQRGCGEDVVLGDDCRIWGRSPSA